MVHFSRDVSTTDGKKGKCKACIAAYVRQRRAGTLVSSKPHVRRPIENGMKVCSGCENNLPLSDFYRNKKKAIDASDETKGVYSICKECSYAKGCLWVSKNRKRYNERARVWAADNKVRLLVKRWSKGRAFTVDDYSAMVKAQGNLCAICGMPPKAGRVLDIDHNHKTGRIRGLLCSQCNKGIGHFSDDQNLLTLAAKYLERCDGLIR